MKKIIFVAVFIILSYSVFAVCYDYDNNYCDSSRGENCETCPWDCACLGNNICSDGTCIPYSPPDVGSCEYSYFSTSNCDSKCPSSSSCEIMAYYRCTEKSCGPDNCICRRCSVSSSNYVCGRSSSSSDTCTYEINKDTNCDGIIDETFYPIKCGYIEGAKCCSDDTCNSGLYCDTVPATDMCCPVGSYWDVDRCTAGDDQCTELGYVVIFGNPWYYYGYSSYYDATDDYACCGGVVRYGGPGNYWIPITVY